MNGNFGVVGISDGVALPRRPVPLLWQVFSRNASVFVAAVVLLAVTPATVSSPVELPEVMILTIGTVTVLAANFVLLRPMLRALDSVAAQLTQARMLRPGESLVAISRVDVTLIEAVNQLLRQLEYQRREIGRTVLAGLEIERKRISRELYDEVGQIMLAVLSLLETVHDDAPPRLREFLRRAIEALRIGAGEFRRISEDLWPALLDQFGIAGALTGLGAAFTAQTGIGVSSRIAPELPALDAGTERVIFCVVRAGLINAARHSAVGQVDLALTEESHQLVLQLTHDGSSMVDTTVECKDSTDMRERVRLIGGDLTISQPTAGGNRIRMVVPLGAPGLPGP